MVLLLELLEEKPRMDLFLEPPALEPETEPEPNIMDFDLRNVIDLRILMRLRMFILSLLFPVSHGAGGSLSASLTALFVVVQ